MISPLPSASSACFLGSSSAMNVLKAHGAAAAFFEKGSWILILLGGFASFVHNYDGDLFALNAYSAVMLVGILCLIVGLAVYEKFGWAGGIIMGPSRPSACSTPCLTFA